MLVEGTALDPGDVEFRHAWPCHFNCCTSDRTTTLEHLTQPGKNDTARSDYERDIDSRFCPLPEALDHPLHQKVNRTPEQRDKELTTMPCSRKIEFTWSLSPPSVNRSVPGVFYPAVQVSIVPVTYAQFSYTPAVVRESPAPGYPQFQSRPSASIGCSFGLAGS